MAPEHRSADPILLEADSLLLHADRQLRQTIIKTNIALGISCASIAVSLVMLWVRFA